jgi:actin related protein 2/3 complex, subunit 2
MTYLCLPRTNPYSEEREALVKSISLLKRNALAAPFETAFATQKELSASGTGHGELLALHYRDEEAIYVQASSDRVTVIFSTIFREETDRIFGKVFLQVRFHVIYSVHNDPYSDTGIR